MIPLDVTRAAQEQMRAVREANVAKLRMQDANRQLLTAHGEMLATLADYAIACREQYAVKWAAAKAADRAYKVACRNALAAGHQITEQETLW